jgi:hypothetical protein
LITLYVIINQQQGFSCHFLQPWVIVPTLAGVKKPLTDTLRRASDLNE